MCWDITCTQKNNLFEKNKVLFDESIIRRKFDVNSSVSIESRKNGPRKNGDGKRTKKSWGEIRASWCVCVRG